ncbi:MAG: hypothetical protein QOF29_485 [bacterium]|jgi:hypothetical protein|nr:hypothetical protein [Solirubrobacteraceae bacterium]
MPMPSAHPVHGSLPGPSRRITVEPLETPAPVRLPERSPAPAPAPERRPAQPAPAAPAR